MSVGRYQLTIENRPRVVWDSGAISTNRLMDDRPTDYVKVVYGTPTYCDVFPIKINIKIKHNLIILFFPEILTLQRIAQWPTFII